MICPCLAKLFPRNNSLQPKTHKKYSVTGDSSSSYNLTDESDWDEEDKDNNDKNPNGTKELNLGERRKKKDSILQALDDSASDDDSGLDE